MTKKEEWEKEFEGRFCNWIVGADNPVEDGEEREIIKSFIRQLLVQSRQELLEEIVKTIEETPIDKAHTYSSENAEEYRIFDDGQESYKAKVRKLIKNLKG